MKDLNLFKRKVLEKSFFTAYIIVVLYLLNMPLNYFIASEKFLEFYFQRYDDLTKRGNAKHSIKFGKYRLKYMKNINQWYFYV